MVATFEAPISRKVGHGVQFHTHSGSEVHVIATRIAKLRAKSVVQETIALWCPVCGFQLNKRGKEIQMEVLRGLQGV